MNKNLVFLFAFSGVLAACSEVTLTDVSDKAKYKDLVGERYEVVGVVDAYGIRKHSKAEVEYITIVPRPGFKGPEVGFRTRVEPGSTITILKVVKTNRILDCGMAFIVTLQGTSLPEDRTTRIETNRGNEGDSCIELNPSIYRKLP
jgi:hypothetical protein